MKIIDYEMYSKDRFQIELEEFDNIDVLALEMMKENSIGNIIPFTFSKYANKEVISYNLKDFSRIDFRNLTEDIMDLLIRSLLECKDQIIKNLLDFNNIFFSSAYIFEKEEDFYYIYIPVEEPQFTNDITKFVKEILLNGKFTKETPKTYLLDLINLIDEGVNFRNYRNIFEERNNELILEDNYLPYFLNNIDVEIPTSIDNEKKVFRILKKLKSSFKKKNEDREEAKSIYNINGEEVKIQNFLKVGSNINIADYIINTKSIEDFHAIISVNKGSLYIEDNNSRTGTYINKKKILPGVEVKLFSGDEIAFGNKKLVFVAK